MALCCGCREEEEEDLEQDGEQISLRMHCAGRVGVLLVCSLTDLWPRGVS